MSLENLILQFNAEFAAASRCYSQRQALRLKQSQVEGMFQGLCLNSTFARIVDMSGGLLGQQALLQAYSPNQRPLSSWAPYAVACFDEKAIVYLDRLCRTLHTLNWLAQGSEGLLFLDVHPRHIQEVRRNHGKVFEAILRRCSLQPQQIVLRLSETDSLEPDHLVRSLECFRARGFAIALVQHGDDHSQFTSLLDLGPDFVQIERPPQPLAEGELAARLVSWALLAHQHNSRVLVHGIDNQASAEIAWLAGVDGIQGDYAEQLAAGAVALDGDEERHHLLTTVRR